MGLTKRSVAMVVTLAIGLIPAARVNAELSPADADRNLTARADVARLKDEATRAFQDSQAKYNAHDIAGACAGLQTSADKFRQMADAEDVIISLSEGNAGSIRMHQDEKVSQLQARDMVLATMAKVCPAAATGAADPGSDDVQARYDADMAEYEALNKAANEHLRLAQSATDITTKCNEYKADLGSMRDALAKVDDMMVLIKEAKADTAATETARASDQATMASVQAIYDSNCAGR